MPHNETARSFIELLVNNPAGLHKNTIKRKLSIGSDSTFYRVLGAARSFSYCTISCRKKVYTIDERQPVNAGSVVPSGDDLVSLVTLQKILSSMTPGVLGDAFSPLLERLTACLRKTDAKAGSWPSRIKILDIRHRYIDEAVFRSVLIAAARRHVVRFVYTDACGRTSRRTASPQQIVRYKDNWYLDAWCHTAEDLRIFSIDAITSVRSANVSYVNVLPERLLQTYATSYGIFSGTPTDVAVIRFTGIAARYVLRESWHPKQKLTVINDTTVELQIPYNKPQELLAEILARGSDAEVLAPQSLREKIVGILEETVARYRKNENPGQ